MTERIIDEEIKLISYYRNDEASLPWYQDLDVCKQVDNRDEPYDLELLHAMHIKFKTLPESKVLSIYHKGSYANIGEARAFLMKYADQNGYTVAGLARECYIDGIWNKESEEEWLTEIQLPIEDVTK